MKANIHDRALKTARSINSGISDLIEILIEVDNTKAFEDHQFTHLTPYCVKFLNIDPDIAKTLVRIVRRSIDVPELAEDVINGVIHVSNAKVICSVITKDNQAEWIKKAKDLPKSQLEKEISAAGGPDKKRVSLDLPLETLELLKRAGEILATKQGKVTSQEDTIAEALKEYVFRHDPVEKAKRSKAAKDSAAGIKHGVNGRDEARCVFIFEDGSQCEERKWLHQHHIIHRADGGEDSIENLACLCAGHHRIIHQMH